MSILEDISSLLQEGRAKQVVALVRQALDEGMNPEVIMNEGLLSGMAVIGEQFKAGEVYVPEVLIAARAMNMGMAGRPSRHRQEPGQDDAGEQGPDRVRSGR